MDSVIVALLIVLPLAAFAAGVAYSQYVISEADAIKQHVTDAETRIREEVSDLKSQFEYLKKL